MRFMVAGAALLATVALGACSPAQQDSGQAADAAYLSTVRDVTPVLTDAQRLAVRDVVCKHLRATPTTAGWVGEVRPLMSQVHVDARGAGSILGASIATACPELSAIAPKV